MFTPEETQSLLAENGIGKTVLQRLQQMGLDDVAKLAAADVDDMRRHAGRRELGKAAAGGKVRLPENKWIIKRRASWRAGSISRQVNALAWRF